jgi:peptide-methionine (S)-S-oxide reductase
MFCAIYRSLLGIALMAATPIGTAAQTASPSMPDKPKTAIATFAGGCFWCVEADFDKVDGVISTTSGYIGGRVKNPTYHQVSAGGTGHAEAVEIVYDPSKVSYAKLVDYFWRHVDPLTKDAQFCDHGHQYRTAIFYHGDEQKQVAEASKKKVAAELKHKVYTEIAPAGPFYKAEGYHQDYYQKNPIRYKFYRYSCGRDARVAEVWGSH